MSLTILIITRDGGDSLQLEKLLISIGYIPKTLNFITATLDSVTSLGTPSEIPLIIFLPGGGDYKQQGIFARELSITGYSVATTMSTNHPTLSSSVNVELGLTLSGTEDYMYSSATNTSFITYQNSILTETNALQAGKIIEVKSNNNPWNNFIEFNNLSPYYVPIAYTDSVRVCFGYLPKGTDTGVYITGAPVFHLGWFFIGMLGKSAIILKDVINYCISVLTPPYFVEGFVKNSNSNPLSRKIACYSVLNNKFIKEVMTDSNGKYSIPLITNDKVFLVCLPDSSSNKNAQIQYNIVPEKVENT